MVSTFIKSSLSDLAYAPAPKWGRQCIDYCIECINLPFIPKNLLQSSDFLQCQVISICMDTLSFCFARIITHEMPEQLPHFIKMENKLFRRLYPGKMKFKFYFMTHFPRLMKDLEPLAYTSCLATETTHQFFKRNKVRNLKILVCCWSEGTKCGPGSMIISKIGLFLPRLSLVHLMGNSIIGTPSTMFKSNFLFKIY